MQELIKHIAQALVDNPDQVSVEKIEGERTIVYELRVAKEDMGKIIGQRGRNIDAIRTILAGVSAKTKMRSILELIEEARTGAMPSDEPAKNNLQDKAGKRKGMVRWYNDVKGYGFITVDEGEDIFVHYRSIEERDQSLMEGDQVTFEVVQGDKGPKAINVKRKGS